ncbi:PREDICTED: trypsin-1-like [Priapulus caudatus]|uniref:Trypsin-1-like n=1 Tax=Priapulus caudatus TaxID=37621 RepID=A0ABM1EWP6_PRICU|nr:PREDICTED: trypsin-1-like [Priapulus caudatus]
MGTVNRNSGGITRFANRIRRHEKYISSDHCYDVAVIELNEPVRFTNNVQPIALASNDSEKNVDWPSTASGFGDTNYNSWGLTVQRRDPFHYSTLTHYTCLHCTKNLKLYSRGCDGIKDTIGSSRWRRGGYYGRIAGNPVRQHSEAEVV